MSPSKNGRESNFIVGLSFVHSGTDADNFYLLLVSSLRGLPPAGWQPFASTYISVENIEVRESYPTEYRKSAPTVVWDENMPV